VTEKKINQLYAKAQSVKDEIMLGDSKKTMKLIQEFTAFCKRSAGTAGQ